MRTYFKLSKGDSVQLNLVNSSWSDCSIKASDSRIASVSAAGMVTMKGKGTATITLKHKKISGLTIVVKVSSGKLNASAMTDQTGTMYSKNNTVYDGSNKNVIPGGYIRMH